MCAGAGAGGGGAGSATGNQGIGSQGQFGGAASASAPSSGSQGTSAGGAGFAPGNASVSPGNVGTGPGSTAGTNGPTSSGVAGNVVRPPTPALRPAASTALTVNTIAAEIGRSPGDAGPTPQSNTGQNDALKRFGASTFLTLSNTKRKTALGV